MYKFEFSPDIESLKLLIENLLLLETLMNLMQIMSAIISLNIINTHNKGSREEIYDTLSKYDDYTDTQNVLEAMIEDLLKLKDGLDPKDMFSPDKRLNETANLRVINSERKDYYANIFKSLQNGGKRKKIRKSKNTKKHKYTRKHKKTRKYKWY